MVFLEMLQQRAPGAVDDALGRAGGAGGIEDVERMIERHPDKIDPFGCPVGRQDVFKKGEPGIIRQVRRRPEEGHHDHPLE